jgi:sugar lactone lactonase YvrE
MFNAPPAIPSRVFARIPDSYRVNGGHSVWVEPTGRIQSRASRAITNVAFGGPGRRQLFMTEGETVADVPVAGMPMFSDS